MERTNILRLIVVGMLLLVPLLFAGQAESQHLFMDERITKFECAVTVETTGELVVTEKISVIAKGENIKRGIYRDFPTRYRNILGLRYSVPFDVLEVMKDGKKEPHHLDDIDGGVRVYIGNADVFIAPGTYTYTLRYRTARQLGFSEKYTELYWNVNGNFWDFPIDEVIAEVSLPLKGAGDILSVEGFTGPMGATGQDFKVEKLPNGKVRYQTTRPFYPREGLTVRVRFSPGIVPAPPQEERYRQLLSENKSTVFAIVGLFFVLMYYIGAWYRAGRDPEAGRIVPRIAPPENISPPAARFITRMDFDNQCFTAALVDLAVRGLVKIDDRQNHFVLEKTGEASDEVPEEERHVHMSLFNGRDSVAMKNTNHYIFSTAMDKLKNSLALNYEKHFFVRNLKLWVPGLVASCGIMVTAIVMEFFATAEAFMLIWLMGWTVGVFAIVRQLITLWKRAGTGAGPKFMAVFFSFFSIPFIGAEIGVTIYYCMTGSPLLLASLLIILGTTILFYRLLKAPTKEGRRLMDQIAGFDQYLRSTEKISATGTMETYDQYLPYAIALGAETLWAKRFAGAMAAAAATQSYTPYWYTGRTWHNTDLESFSNYLGSSFSASVSSSAAAPGSSSSGGSSGGGGGGGGGGGW